MKKIAIILLFSIIGHFASAQIIVGPQFGMNIGTLSHTDLTIDSKWGCHGGLFLGLPLSKHVYIMPAVLYSNKGFKYDYSTTTTNTAPDTSGTNVTSVVNLTANVDATLGYLDIPVLLTVFTGETRGFMFQAGPQFSYLIKDNSNITTSSTISINGGTSQPTTPTTDTKVTFHKGDLALAAGIGYKLPSFLMVYARVTTGILKVQQNGFIKDENAGRNFLVEIGGALVFGGR